MRVVIDDGGRAASGYKGEANDCVCRAIAIATERPYQEIYDALKALMEPGKRGRSGVEELTQHKLMETLGWTWVTPTKKVHLREDELPSGRLAKATKPPKVILEREIYGDTQQGPWINWRQLNAIDRVLFKSAAEASLLRDRS